MIKTVVKDTILLSKKSVDATKDDLYIVEDLKDTLIANKDRCIGMAANMIGYNKRIIVVSLGILTIPMINPVITKKSGAYQASEGCLSLVGERNTTRYNDIEVDYYDTSFNKHHSSYSGLIAEIIQHECDHLEGIII